MTCPRKSATTASPTTTASRRAPHVARFIVRESRRSRATGARKARCATTSFGHNIVAIADIDTRALTRKLRSGGVMRGVVMTGSQLDPNALVDKARAIPKMEGSDLVRGVTTSKPFDFVADHHDDFAKTAGSDGEDAAEVSRRCDFGMKRNILRRLSAHGCDVRVCPRQLPHPSCCATKPDGVFLSNGPGDPAVLTYAIDNAKAARERPTCRRSASASVTRSSASRWAARRSS